MKALYTDGTPVIEGDSIRYRQTPGGLIAPSGKWDYGIATKFPHPDHIREYAATHPDWAYDLDELHLLTSEGRYLHIAPHIIERQNHETFNGTAGTGDDRWCIEHQRHEWIA